MKIPMIVLKILFVGALLIVSNQNLHLSDETERGVFFEAYLAWVGSLVDQGVKVTSYVVKFEWLPPKDTEDLQGLIDSRNKS
jgi:hypothetical protein